MSAKYSLNKEDALKIGKGAIIAVSGALLTYALQVVGTIDFGTNTVLIVPILTILINAGLKFIQGGEKSIDYTSTN